MGFFDFLFGAKKQPAPAPTPTYGGLYKGTTQLNSDSGGYGDTFLAGTSGNWGSSTPYTAPKTTPAPAPSYASSSTGGSSGPTSSTGAISLTPPDTTYTGPSEAEILAGLRGEYDLAAQEIGAAGSELDQTYGLTKGDIEGDIAQTQAQGGLEKERLGRTYGDLLSQSLRNYKDLGLRTNNLYSGLGTIDSSSFINQNLKNDQNYIDDSQRIGREKADKFADVEARITNYVGKANSDLARLAIEYQSGKDAIARALSSGRLDEANAIQEAMANVRATAQATRNNLSNFINSVNTLKAQGLNVRADLSGINSDQFAGALGGDQTQRIADFNNLVPENVKGQISQFITQLRGKNQGDEDIYAQLLQNYGQDPNVAGYIKKQFGYA